MSIDDLDWGAATPELYSAEERQAMHVINANCIGESRRERVRRFVVGRLIYYSKHLPEETSQWVRFDIRGQAIGTNKLNEFRAEIVADAAKNGIEVGVDFLSSC